ncbi:MAG TPA: hypothetical protein PK413_03635 [Thermoanaerobaculia bacterium]|nr:hypothetical protein [Thermoanaerobaculia bacterium]
MSTTNPPRFVAFDSTPEIFATDSNGSFSFALARSGESFLQTESFDEARFVVSLWHPSGQRSIDLDRAYVELRACFDQEELHWIKLAEVEPVVPPYAGGESFDGWVVLPIMASSSAFALVGSGFEPRSRLQIRASVYLVA